MNHLTGDVRKMEISIYTSVRVTRESQFSTLSCFLTHKCKSKVPYFPVTRTVPPSIDLHSIYHPMQFDIKAFHVRHKPQFEFPPAVIHSSIDISRVTKYFRGKPKDLSKIFHSDYLSIDNPNLVTLSQWTETFLKLLTPPSFRNRSSSFLLLPTLFFARFVVVVVVLPLSDSHPPRQRHSRQVALISSSSASGRLTTIGYIR